MKSILKFVVLLISLSQTVCQIIGKSEICPCVPLNICPNHHHYNENDGKYFHTVLKCTELNHVRCCPDNEVVSYTLKRSDDSSNLIYIDSDEIVPKSEPVTEDSVLETTEATTFDDFEMTTEEFDGKLTTTVDDLTTTEQKLDTTESSLIVEKFIEANSIDVIYSNHKYPEDEKSRELREHLFLIFPNGEIKSALATTTNSPFIPLIQNESIKQTTPTGKARRVVVRKRILNKKTELLEGAESQKSSTVVEPKQMDVDEVKKRLMEMYKQTKRKNDFIAQSTLTTENPIDKTTTMHQRRKKMRFRKQKQPIQVTLAPSTTTMKSNIEKQETTTNMSKRKLIYDTSSRMNFLKRTAASQTEKIEDDYQEPEIDIQLTDESVNTLLPHDYLNIQNLPKQSLVVKFATEIDNDHKLMIETLHKTLSALHAGADENIVEEMIEAHKVEMEELRNVPTTVESIQTPPTRPYRGMARFKKPVTSKVSPSTQSNEMRTRNLSRFRNTPTRTTQVPVQLKLPRTFSTSNSDLIFEDINMPPKQKPPADFKASPLYGLTMDRDNDFDTDKIEKIYETLRPSSQIQNGFFPVIQNGMPLASKVKNM